MPLNIPNIKFRNIDIAGEKNEYRSRPESGKTKVRKKFTYARKEIMAETNSLSITEATEIQNHYETVETTTSWIFTDPREEAKLIFIPISATATTVTLPSSYRADRFYVGQEVEIIKTDTSTQLNVITDITNTVLTFNDAITGVVATVKGNINYRVTFIEVPKLKRNPIRYDSVTLKMKEL